MSTMDLRPECKFCGARCSDEGALARHQESQHAEKQARKAVNKRKD